MVENERKDQAKHGSPNQKRQDLDQNCAQRQKLRVNNYFSAVSHKLTHQVLEDLRSKTNEEDRKRQLRVQRLDSDRVEALEYVDNHLHQVYDVATEVLKVT